jgi:hypothetical protein
MFGLTLAAYFFTHAQHMPCGVLSFVSVILLKATLWLRAIRIQQVNAQNRSGIPAIKLRSKLRHAIRRTMEMPEMQTAFRKCEPVAFLLTLFPAGPSRWKKPARDRPVSRVCETGEAVWPRPGDT